MQLAFDISMGDNIADFDQPGVEEDRAALSDFERTGMGIPWEEVRDWMSSWGTANERPRPQPRKLR